jgi:hypothetical protein
MAVILQRAGILGLDKKSSIAVEITGESQQDGQTTAQEAMGEPALNQTTPGQIEDEKLFSLIMSDLNGCFDIKGGAVPESVPVTIEAIFSAVLSDLGAPIGQADRSMNWHLKNHEGVERRLRLEITEADDGQVLRELKYFAVDPEGLPIPVEVSADKRINPSDEVVNHMLKEGDVFYKEKSAYAIFADNSRIEFTEKNGKLAEFEFQKGNSYFRCQSLAARDGCQCIR